MTTTQTITAAQVKTAASRATQVYTGKVLTYDLWVQLNKIPGIAIPMCELHEELLRLASRREIRLMTLDLVDGIDPQKVEVSYFTNGASEFHGVRI